MKTRIVCLLLLAACALTALTGCTRKTQYVADSFSYEITKTDYSHIENTSTIRFQFDVKVSSAAYEVLFELIILDGNGETIKTYTECSESVGPRRLENSVMTISRSFSQEPLNAESVAIEGIQYRYSASWVYVLVFGLLGAGALAFLVYRFIAVKCKKNPNQNKKEQGV